MVPTCVPTDTTLGPPTAANLASRGDQPPFLPSTSLTTSTRDAVPTRRRTACCTDDVQNARPLRPDATTSFTKVGPLAYPPQEGRRHLGFHFHPTSAADMRRLHSPDSTPAVPAVQQAGDDTTHPTPTSMPLSNSTTFGHSTSTFLTPLRRHRRRSTTTPNTHAARSPCLTTWGSVP